MKGIKQIKHYRLTREIGKGTTGNVYEAIDEKTNKLLAVKSILSAKLKDKRVMENFKRELKLLHGLNHNNIVKIAGVEKTVNNIYLILEYCNGGNLYEYLHFYTRLHGAALPEENVQVILRQLIDGLEYMHNCRTIHRDIKLENILVNFNSVPNIVEGSAVFKIDYSQMNLLDITVKIADLGYARELEGAGVASTMCGTPITMAPDIVTNAFNKDNKYNNKIDLWSLGAITYELIVGRPVFSSNSITQLFEEIMSGRYMLPKNLKISIEAISFINGLLQFYPEKRMNWNQIRNHPFIVNEVKNFHYIDLTTVENIPENRMVDTKDCENFLWVLYQTKFAENIHIDKIDVEIFQTIVVGALPLIKENENSESKIKEQSENEVEPKPNLNKDEVSSKSKDELMKDEISDVYEEADNELCICDNKVEIVKHEENNKPIEIEEKNEIKVTQAESESKENRIFGKILMQMKLDLKNSKNNSKNNSKIINQDDNGLKQEDKEIEADMKIANNCQISETKTLTEDVIEVKKENPKEDRINFYDDCTIIVNEDNQTKDSAPVILPAENLEFTNKELEIKKENEQDNITDPEIYLVENRTVDSKQEGAKIGTKSVDIPSEENKDSALKESDSNLIQIESISEERISAYYKENSKYFK